MKIAMQSQGTLTTTRIDQTRNLLRNVELKCIQPSRFLKHLQMSPTQCCCIVTSSVLLARERIMFLSFIREFKAITGEVSLHKSLPRFVFSICIQGSSQIMIPFMQCCHIKSKCDARRHAEEKIGQKERSFISFVCNFVK